MVASRIQASTKWTTSRGITKIAKLLPCSVHNLVQARVLGLANIKKHTMKIKKLPNSPTVIVEFEELYSISDDRRADAITDICTEFSGRRTAYNMWKFDNIKLAEEFIFMYSLKYATST